MEEGDEKEERTGAKVFVTMLNNFYDTKLSAYTYVDSRYLIEKQSKLIENGAASKRTLHFFLLYSSSIEFNIIK
jgi:hypothetical protein